MRRFLVSVLVVAAATAVGCGSSTPTTQPAASVTVTTAPPASSASESLPTYPEVVGTYPSGASVVDFEAQFDEIMDYGDEGYYVPIEGEYEGMRIGGAFTVNLHGAYIGSPGVLWEYIDDTRMPGWPPGSSAWDWAEYEKVVVPLAKKNPAFSTLYYDTFTEMWGPRLTSNTGGDLGGVQVQPGDKLTFDARQRLVKVSAWSGAAPAPSVATATPSTDTGAPEIVSGTRATITVGAFTFRVLRVVATKTIFGLTPKKMGSHERIIWVEFRLPKGQHKAFVGLKPILTAAESGTVSELAAWYGAKGGWATIHTLTDTKVKSWTDPDRFEPTKGTLSLAYVVSKDPGQLLLGFSSGETVDLTPLLP